MIHFKRTGVTRKSVSPGIATSGLLTLDNPLGWLTGDSTQIAPEQSMKLSAVYRAVNYLSDMMGMIPVSVRNWNTMEPVPDHYLGKVLWHRPNTAMSPFVYKKLMEANRLLYGNAYAYINRDGDGRPIELIPLWPNYVSVNLSSSGALWYRYTHPISGVSYALDSMEVLHYKGYSEDGITGTSVLHHAALIIQTAIAREEYDKAVYENGGSPAGILQTDSDMNGFAKDASGNLLTDDDGKNIRLRDVIRSEWDRTHGGAKNAFRIAVLDLGLKYQPLSVSNKDAQFVESKGVSVEDIARFFGVPKNKLFNGKESYSSNEANSLDVMTDTLQPIVTQYEEEDKWKLLTTQDVDLGLEIYRNMMVTLRTDTETRGTWFQTMREIGAYSVNDILREEGRKPVPGGDLRYASLNYVPLADFQRLSELRAKKNGGENGAN